MRIDHTSPSWATKFKATQERQERARIKAADLPGPQTRPHRWSVQRVESLFAAQKGKCANSGCRAPLTKYGRGRAIDLTLNIMLCKACSIALGNARRKRGILLGLARLLK